MRIIKENGQLKISKGVIAGDTTENELDYNVEFDPNTRFLIKQNNFPKIVAGDNNSITIKIKSPLEYNGINLSEKICIIPYKTDWIDDNGNFSAGQVEPNKEIFDNYIIYSWKLDQKQTLKPGNCAFNICFLENLDTDEYKNNVSYSPELNKTDNYIDIVEENINETELRYWSLGSLSCVAPILNPELVLDNNYNLILPTNITAELENINLTIEENIPKISELDAQINSAETGLQATVDKLELDLYGDNSQDNKGISERINEAEDNIGILDEITKTNKDRIDDIDETISGHTTTLTSHGGTLNTLDSRITANESSILSHSNSISSLNSTVNKLDNYYLEEAKFETVSNTGKDGDKTVNWYYEILNRPNEITDKKIVKLYCQVDVNMNSAKTYFELSSIGFPEGIAISTSFYNAQATTNIFNNEANSREPRIKLGGEENSPFTRFTIQVANGSASNALESIAVSISILGILAETTE